MSGDPSSLSALFDQWRRNQGVFLQDEGDSGSSRVTYAGAAGYAAGYVNKLRSAGIGPGDRVVFWSENRTEWVIALWSCILEGVVAVPVDYRSSPALVLRIAEIVQAKSILIGDVPRFDAPPSTPVWQLAGVTAESAAPQSFREAEAPALAEVLFTSGATGDPKGVTITHRNLLANLQPIHAGIARYKRYMRPFSPIRFLNLLPLSHMFGQSMAAFIPPMIAGTVIFTPGYNPQSAARLVKRRKVSVIVCVPQMLELLRQYVLQAVPEAAEPARGGKWYRAWWQYRRVHRLFGWKFWSFVVGAAPLDPSLEAFWRKLGFVVIQGYGLTETAPVATLNHPFETRQGSVGKPIAGVEIRIAPDGEILLRGENVTPGYYGDTGTLALDEEGWFHTGDIGELDAENRLSILGRKKEMIVSADGLNVFPEDVERALNAQRGVRESAVVAAKQDAREQVHAVLVVDPTADAEAIIRDANAVLEPYQRVRGFSIWQQPSLPRTAGTNKLKRAEVAAWVAGAAPGSTPAPTPASQSDIEDVLRKYAAGHKITSATTIDELGLSSLDRIQLMMDIEQRTGVSVDESQFAKVRTVGDIAQLKAGGAAPSVGGAAFSDDFEFPEWNRSAPARALRRVALPGLILPLGRLFARIRVEGLQNLEKLEGPVIFASNHQSHFDAPMILSALPLKYRYRTSIAMAKEFFDAHFHPERFSGRERFTNSLNYYLSALVFNAFPLPQRESGTRAALRYAGDLVRDGWSVLIFPEGKRTEAGEILPFRPGVGMLAARLHIPIVPVRLEGLHHVLHKTAKFPTPGRASVRFGAAITPDPHADYAAIAKQVEDAVKGVT